MSTDSGDGKARLAILISGRGSNMQSLVAACDSGQLAAKVCLVASNNPEAEGLPYAAGRGIKTISLDHRQFASRTDFETQLAKSIDDSGAEYVLLAGFMRILGESFVSRYQGRMLNIHPSLLPAYPGLDTHARAIANGDTEAGASVHFVTPELDGGPVMIQARVRIEPDDSSGKLAQRVLEAEHRMYPIAVAWLVEGLVSLQNGQCHWQGEAMPSPRLLGDIEASA